MLLTETIKLIVSNLQAGRYPNEQATSLMAVLPVLRDLQWDIMNPSVVWPEYSVGGRVDYALCHPESHQDFPRGKATGQLGGR